MCMHACIYIYIYIYVCVVVWNLICLCCFYLDHVKFCSILIRSFFLIFTCTCIFFVQRCVYTYGQSFFGILLVSIFIVFDLSTSMIYLQIEGNFFFFSFMVINSHKRFVHSFSSQKKIFQPKETKIFVAIYFIYRYRVLYSLRRSCSWRLLISLWWIFYVGGEDLLI